MAASSGPLSRAIAPAKIHGWRLATSRSFPGFSVRMRRLVLSKRSTNELYREDQREDESADYADGRRLGSGTIVVETLGLRGYEMA